MSGVMQLLKNIAMVEGQVGRDSAAKQTVLRFHAVTADFHEFVKVHNLGEPKEVVTLVSPCHLPHGKNTSFRCWLSRSNGNRMQAYMFEHLMQPATVPPSRVREEGSPPPPPPKYTWKQIIHGTWLRSHQASVAPTPYKMALACMIDDTYTNSA